MCTLAFKIQHTDYHLVLLMLYLLKLFVGTLVTAGRTKYLYQHTTFPAWHTHRCRCEKVCSVFKHSFKSGGGDSSTEVVTQAEKGRVIEGHQPHSGTGICSLVQRRRVSSCIVVHCTYTYPILSSRKSSTKFPSVGY